MEHTYWRELRKTTNILIRTLQLLNIRITLIGTLQSSYIKD